MRKGVADPKEGVGKGHAGNGCRVVHLLPCLHPVFFPVHGLFQILEHQPYGLHGLAVRVVAGHDRSVGLYGVCQDIKACRCRKGSRLVHDKIRIHYGHVRSQGVVRNRVLYASLLVRDDRKGRHFRACARGRGDADHLRLAAEFRKGDNALSYVHEAQGNVVQLHGGHLVHEPDYLGSVHGRAAAKGNEQIRLKAVGKLKDAFCRSHVRVRVHVAEDAHIHAEFVQNIRHLGDKAKVHHGLVRDDQAALLVRVFLQGRAQAAKLEVDLARHAEPEHVFPSAGHGLDVHEMFHPDVLAHGIAAPAAAAKCQRRGHAEVVDIANGTLGGRHVDERAARGHALFENLHPLLAGLVRVEGRGVASTAKQDELARHLHCRFKVLCLIEAKHRGELFVGKGIRGIYGRALGYEHLGLRGNLDARHIRYSGSGLAHDIRVQAPLGKDHACKLLSLFRPCEPGTVAQELLAHCVSHAFHHDHGLLGGADHAVVEGLAEQNGVHGHADVGLLVDDDRGVACTHANGRRAGAVGGVHHAGPASCQDERNAPVAHELARGLHGGMLYAGKDIFRSARFHCGLQNEHDGFPGGLGRTGVGRKDSAVSGLEANQCLEDGCGGGVGSGHYAGHNAQGFRYLAVAVHGVVGYHAAGGHVLVLVIDVFRGKVVLDDLVFHNAHACLLDSHAGKVYAVGCSHCRCVVEDGVHLFLGVGRVDLLGLDYALDQGVKLFCFGLLLFHVSCPLYGCRRAREMGMVVCKSKAKGSSPGRDLQELYRIRGPGRERQHLASSCARPGIFASVQGSPVTVARQKSEVFPDFALDAR